VPRSPLGITSNLVISKQHSAGNYLVLISSKGRFHTSRTPHFLSLLTRVGEEAYRPKPSNSNKTQLYPVCNRTAEGSRGRQFPTSKTTNVSKQPPSQGLLLGKVTSLIATNLCTNPLQLRPIKPRSYVRVLISRRIDRK